MATAVVTIVNNHHGTILTARSSLEMTTSSAQDTYFTVSPVGSYYSIRTNSNKYVATDETGAMYYRDTYHTDARWTLVYNDNRTYSFLSYYQKYLCGERNRQVKANRTRNSNWEKWKITLRQGTFPPIAEASGSDHCTSMYTSVWGAIVSIYVYIPGWVGSGFVYKHGNSYYIITAAHVIMDSDRNNSVIGPIFASVPTEDGVVTVQCTVKGVAGTADIGVLQIPEGTAPRHHVFFASSCPPAGTCCAVLGDPLGIDSISISEGVVRDPQYIYNVDPSGCSIIESVSVTCPVYGGNSGSGIFDENGKVIGLVSYGTGEVFSWGVTVPYLETIANSIIETGSNFIGNTLDATIVMVDMWYQHNFSISSSELHGLYVHSSSTANLSSGDIITEIEGHPIGLYYQYDQKTPMLLYMHSSSSITVTVVPQGSSTSVTRTVQLVPVSLSSDLPLFSSEDAETIHTEGLPPPRHLELKRPPPTPPSSS